MKEVNNTIDFEDYLMDSFSSEEDIKHYLNASLKDYLSDGDFNSFYKSLEIAVRAKGTISEFADNVGISRTHLYSIFNAKKEPKFSTIAKIFRELGYELEVA